MTDKMDLVLSQLKELHMIVTSIRDRQEETDAKIEAMAMDLHQLNGRVGRLESRMDNLQLELSDFRRETALNFSRNDRHIQAIERELDQTKYRVGQLEEELKRTGT